MPVITLPDSSKREFDHPVTVHDVAASIGTGLAKAALAGKVNGELVDTSYLIEHRITSYNVCYTKLLRLLRQLVHARFDLAQLLLGEGALIGSYNFV